MGKKEETVKKVVLDTNILVSALLFKGELSGMVELWKQRAFIPVFDRETFKEFKAVLGYPKFFLTDREIRMIIEEEVLPFFEIVEGKDRISGICRDSGDDKFIECAIAASAAFIVSGDSDLLEIGKYRSVRIISARKFLAEFI